MSPMMSGKVALVTGGSQGIGRAAASAFAREGAAVIIASRNETRGQQAAAEICAEGGGPAAWMQVDVSQAAQVEALIQAIVKQYGKLDYAFNNAGSGGMGGWIHEQIEAEWDKTIDGYLKSVYLCMKYEILTMLEHGSGAIVNTSSVDGQRAFPWDPVYSAAKHGVLGLTKSCAMQYITRGIRINAVCPGWIDTPAVAGIKENPDTVRGVMMHQPIGRFGKPEEVANAVVWLCSDQASMLVGTALAVDGGYLIV